MHPLLTRLALAALATLVLLPCASAVITTAPTRFDLGEEPLGATIERVVTVQNRGAEPTEVRVVAAALEAEVVDVQPAAVTIPPGETRDVSIRIALPANASGGRHDVRLSFLESPPGEGGTTVGQAGLLVPVIFEVRNLKIGNFQAHDVLLGEDASTSVLVQNFLALATEPAIAIEVLDGSGAVVARISTAAPRTEANATTVVPLDVPTRALLAGAYRLRAVATSGEAKSNAWEVPILVGEKRLALGAVAVAAAGGRVSLSVPVTNAGAAPLDGTVTFRILDAAGKVLKQVDAQAIHLPAGGSTDAVATSDVAPGDFRVEAVARWAGGNASGSPAAFSVPAPPAPAPKAGVPGPEAALVLVGAVAAVAVRRR